MDLTLVIDIGKTHAKLLLLDEQGAVVDQYTRANFSVSSPQGYQALDVRGLEAWMQATLCTCQYRKSCTRVIVSAHGAAVVALGPSGLAWDPVDYEFADVGELDLADRVASEQEDPFFSTLSPDLPAGLNAARQLAWIEDRCPQAWSETRCLMPYAQYWTWLLSGVACSEVSSLGCHSHLWKPTRGEFSDLAIRRSWGPLFAPIRSAWEPVGPVRPEIAQSWGLPQHCQVHVGVHDSNACLAQFLRGPELRSRVAGRPILVSSGTWTVIMAPGGRVEALRAGRDMLGNVDVLGRVTPTARFMGGREFKYLSGDAVLPHDWSKDLDSLFKQGIYALPAFVALGGPFAGRKGSIVRRNQPMGSLETAGLTEGQRAVLAAMYCAQVTSVLVNALGSDCEGDQGDVIVEGPFARNPAFMALLQSLLPQRACYASKDDLEGTARGAWVLSRWESPHRESPLEPAIALGLDSLKAYHTEWIQRLGRVPA